MAYWETFFRYKMKHRCQARMFQKIIFETFVPGTGVSFYDGSKNLFCWFKEFIAECCNCCSDKWCYYKYPYNLQRFRISINCCDYCRTETSCRIYACSGKSYTDDMDTYKCKSYDKTSKWTMFLILWSDTEDFPIEKIPSRRAEPASAPSTCAAT